jgi:hypothetical protein
MNTDKYGLRSAAVVEDPAAARSQLLRLMLRTQPRSDESFSSVSIRVNPWLKL